MPANLIDSGMLEVGEGHALYWEMAGNPRGLPAIVLHGGPGSGCREGHYGLFDLQRYRVVLLDQRGAGRSRPAASETASALAHNTTDHLLQDIETLRAHLGIDRWLVFGGSWGSTLALLYAQQHPDRIVALVLSGVATTGYRELLWLYEDIGAFFPEAHADFRAFAPEARDTWALIDAYGEALAGPDLPRAQAAADAWCRWEVGIFQQTLEEAGGVWTDPAFRLGFARIVTHYFRHRIWREDRHVLENMHRIAHLPAVMVHSRFDPSCPLRGAWELAQVWPAARLEVLDGGAHSALAADMTSRIRSATDAFGLEAKGSGHAG